MSESRILDSHDEPLVTLRSFGTEAEAAIAQGLLKDNGIPAFTYGGQTATTLFYVGTALGGVRLQVPESRAEEAAELLAAELDEPERIPAWTCPNCSAAVNAGFAVCWQCDRDYAPGEIEPTQNAPATVLSQPSVDEADTNYAEDLANRAWKAAVFGIFLPPFIFYSSYLVLRCFGKDLSPAGQRKFFGAAVLSAFWPFVWMSVLRVTETLGP